MRYRVMICVSMVALILFAALPASANVIGKVTVTDSCSGFTITASGTGLGKPSITVTFTITLTPTSGPPTTITDTFVVTRIPHSGGSYNTSYTQTWAHYGVTLTSTYTLSGKASFLPSHPKTFKAISFSPPTLDCAVVTGSCQPSSSLGVLAHGTTVTAYVPNGSWGNTGSLGLTVVPVEPTGVGTPISTPNAVNSCASNSTTGETVCTSNLNDVYLITGSTLNTTVSSGGDQYTGFSGGACITCGVAMNATAGPLGSAVVTIGLSTAPSGSGLQILDLATSTFAAPVPAFYEVSEDILWDQGRNLVLSPDEGGVYDLFDTKVGGEFGNSISTGGEPDSAAEECTTGIALSTVEFTSNLYLADLTQATFTPGSPGTWTTPPTAQTLQNFSPAFDSFAAGTSGIAIAQGSHLGIVTGEFGGDWMGVIQLPATSGSGTPSVLDWVAAELPPTPDGNGFVQGADPHTVTAYVSPNSPNHAIGLMSNGYFTPPTWLAVIDLTKLLACTQTVPHFADASCVSSVVTYVSIP